MVLYSFEWDEEKDIMNQKRHSIAFVDAQSRIAAPTRIFRRVSSLRFFAVSLASSCLICAAIAVCRSELLYLQFATATPPFRCVMQKSPTLLRPEQGIECSNVIDSNYALSGYFRVPNTAVPDYT